MATSPFIEGQLVTHYYRAYRDFSVFTRESAWKSDKRSFDVRFSWSGELLPITLSRNIDSPTFIRGLFCIGLFTTEIEEVIGANITAHQKMEWALEYEAEDKFCQSLMKKPTHAAKTALAAPLLYLALDDKEKILRCF